MTALLILLAAATAAAPPAPSPSPTPALTILLAKPEGAPPPQGGSLAEVAKRIKLKLPGDRPRVLTNETVKQLAEGVELTTAAPGAGGGAAVAPGAAADESKKARWQQRYRSAVQRVAALEAEVKSLEARANELEREFYSHDDPAYRDSTIKPNWDNTLTQLQKTKDELEAARKQPDEVLNAARRDGALPGWFRGLDSETAPALPPAAQGGARATSPARKVPPTPTPLPPESIRPVGPS